MRVESIIPRITAVCVIMVTTGMLSPGAVGGDWPQILGPNRTGIAADEQLAMWPADGPKLLWSQPVGEGFAGVAVSGQVVVAFHREGAEEVVEAFRVGDGRRLWRSPFACSYRGGISSDNGPRCVPLISQHSVFVLGVSGQLRALSLEDGTPVWSRDLEADYSPAEGYFGVGSTPVLHEGRLIVNVGSRNDAAVVAFDAKTGKSLWQTFADTASYSSPIIAPAGTTNHAVVITRLNLVALDPVSGDVKWQFPFGQRGPTVNGATPVVLGDHLFVSSSYNIGSMLIRIGGNDPAAMLWRDTDLLATQYATPVEHNGLLYAVDGRQDAGPGRASLKCIDVLNRRILWEEPGFDYGSLVRVGDEFLFLTCSGELIRFQADSAKYREVSRSRILNQTDSGYRLPAVSNGRLFVRDDETLKVLEVGKMP
ncbi:MAG: PQQ-like beta-propeller repeat protein [Planctomycetaceae bacterium]|nr:PQQ-like beta-propeller repeat protein [Planctomycetaceae bacterium]